MAGNSLAPGLFSLGAVPPVKLYEKTLGEGRSLTAERLLRFIELSLPGSIFARANAVRKAMQLEKAGFTEEDVEYRRSILDNYPLDRVLSYIKRVPRSSNARNEKGGRTYWRPFQTGG